MSLQLISSNKNSDKKSLPIIAIDGPAGAGKSTAARMLAYQLGFVLVDTGALYRALALAASERGIDLTHGSALEALTESLKINFSQLERHGDDPIPRQKIFLGGLDVSETIRTPEMGMMASNISKLPEVRRALLQMQRDFGERGGIVMEGRDIGTVIFPRAEIKFFLSANLESRAKRRYDELKSAGLEVNFSQVVKETAARDEQDMNRSHAPLKKAEDAILIDSTSETLSDVVAKMARMVRDSLK